MINPSDNPVTLRKDTVIASMQQLDDDAIKVFSTAEQPPSYSISQKKYDMLWDIVQRADDLTKSEGDTLFSLLLSFEDVFATDSRDLGHTTVIKHTIDTGSAQPIRQPPRRLPPHCREQACELIGDMLKKRYYPAFYQPMVITGCPGKKER